MVALIKGNLGETVSDGPESLAFYRHAGSPDQKWWGVVWLRGLGGALHLCQDCTWISVPSLPSSLSTHPPISYQWRPLPKHHTTASPRMKPTSSYTAPM